MGKIARLSRVGSPADVPTERKVPELVRVPGGIALAGTVISDGVFALTTHHVGGRTVLCGGEGDCKYHDLAPTRFYGLIALWDRNDGQKKWVQLPAQATQSLLSQIQELQVPMLGVTVKIGRTRKAANSPVIITVDPYARGTSVILKPLVPDETIERVFNSPKSAPQIAHKLVN